MKLIGKGTFTTAYLKADGKTVLLKSKDPIKECMSLGWFPDHKLFPVITPSDKHNEYEMLYYPRVSSLKGALKPAQWALYKELRLLSYSFKAENRRDTIDALRNTFKKVRNKNVSKVLIEAVEACGNFGTDIGFEISPRNVRAHKGRLILLDCFFLNSKLTEVRKEKKRRSYI